MNRELLTNDESVTLGIVDSTVCIHVKIHSCLIYEQTDSLYEIKICVEILMNYKSKTPFLK